jgi:hypothetical protein
MPATMNRKHSLIPHRLRPIVLVLLLCALPGLLLPGPARADQPQVQNEYRLKAAFLYNFARFTSWPESDATTFNVCIIGDNHFNGAVDSLREKLVHDLPLTVSYIDDTRNAADCQLLYVSNSLAAQADRILAELGRLPILTISDMDGFIRHGGIIGFLSINNRIRFEINVTAASDKGLSISSKLLSLATTVRTTR